jgi:hypothetical protein
MTASFFNVMISLVFILNSNAGATAASVCLAQNPTVHCAAGTYSGSSGEFQLPLRACSRTAELQGMAQNSCSIARAMKGWILFMKDSRFQS